MAATYNELYLNARQRLRAIGVEEDQLEARELICLASNKTREEFLRDRSYYSSSEIEARMEELLLRREAGEPVAYLVGEWEFYGLTLEVDRGVLIPRPDTEVLAERAIYHAGQVKESCRVLDLCAGSGCVGLAVASQVSGCRVLLADWSEDALRVARKNVRKTDSRGQVGCDRVNALEKPSRQLGSFNVIACNPPYIRRGDLAGLDASVRDYEPTMALDGGEDGLDFYRAITKNWKAALRPGGVLLFEVGYDQADDVIALMEQQGYQDIQTFQDGGGIRRVVEGHR